MEIDYRKCKSCGLTGTVLETIPEGQRIFDEGGEWSSFTVQLRPKCREQTHYNKHGADLYNKPMAAEGLVSYRLKSTFGYIMIGAIDHDDAMREAARGTPNPKRENLEVWNGSEYVNA